MWGMGRVDDDTLGSIIQFFGRDGGLIHYLRVDYSWWLPLSEAVIDHHGNYGESKKDPNSN